MMKKLSVPGNKYLALSKKLIAGLLLLVSSILPAQADQAAVNRLGSLLDKMDSLDAGFQQRILDARGARLQEVDGKLSLKRPGKFYWQTENPFPQTVVSDGSTLWLFDPDLEQVTIQQIDESISRTPAMLLSGDVASITEKFEVLKVRDSDIEEFVLRPKEEESLFEELRLNFADQWLVSLLLVDSLGQRTAIELRDVRFNQEQKAGRYTFNVPDGVDVIQQ
ncbi:outer membrane lipoprotein chaperone LolA [Oceanospirillum sediminis]|uniref:Outer-membrane lipoprotein carrier protein n=1 Tax=Oceanospirillum sediminis TaxID=2760088 RepID=A0A839IU85_9GAMM|nr:outer membrane lipoprotein chaperone LolA [Oceanospirillum sediminis]MBB1488491.1 outer membrane lipoprotein chaperone LolA [Oceanospirillum sediminis]